MVSWSKLKPGPGTFGSGGSWRRCAPAIWARLTLRTRIKASTNAAIQSGSMPLQVGSKNFAEFTMLIHGTTSWWGSPYFYQLLRASGKFCRVPSSKAHIYSPHCLWLRTRGMGAVGQLEACEAVRPSDLEARCLLGVARSRPDSSRPRHGRTRSRLPGQLEVGA